MEGEGRSSGVSSGTPGGHGRGDSGSPEGGGVQAGRREKSEVIVVGAGPAGISAALQLERSGISTFLLEAGTAGGLVENASLVENYPGFPGGIEGPRLAALLRRQLDMAGVKVTAGRVLSLECRDEDPDKNDGPGRFVAVTEEGTYLADYAVIASGTLPVVPFSIAIQEEARESIFFEIAGMPETEGKVFAVIGGGDGAFDYALSLSKKNDVMIIMRGNEPSCLPLLLERCRVHPRISMRPATETRKIGKAEEGGGLLIGCAGPGGVPFDVSADYVLMATGRRPNLDFIGEGMKERIDLLSRRGFLYLVGDVCNGDFRQVAISAGDGIKAAMMIDRTIRFPRKMQCRDDYGKSSGGQ